MRSTLLLAFLLLASCRSAYYATMESLGVHKRDLLVERVEAGREEQKAAQQQFEATYQAFRGLTDFDGGDLEAMYERLKDELSRCESEAGDVSARIVAIEHVAGDLFEEWESEIGEYQNAELKRNSRESLEATRARYGQLIGAMGRAESKMEPVLVAFRDHVRFLKHNLNARAIAFLESTVLGVETDVTTLIDDMRRSIAEADAFIASIEGAG